VPHEPVLENQHIISEAGKHDLVALETYEAPSGVDGEVIYDKYKHQDLGNARWMSDVLQSVYGGYPWRCIYDGRQKMAYLSIPILMGINKFWAINLVTDELTRGLLIRAGGALLERYGQSRTKFNVGSFLDAREKHSALVVASRKVPE
jgi:hypothetical protein